MNIADVLLQLQDLAEAPFDPVDFPIRLIEAYGPPASTLAKLRQGLLNKAAAEGDLLWPKKLHFRPTALGSASVVLEDMIADWRTKRTQPRLLIATDGVDLLAFDFKLDDTLSTSVSKITERYDFLLPLGGVERYQGVPDSPADIKAAGTLARFYDAVLEANPDWTAHQKVHELNLFLTRILFCMFAQSTGIFRTGLFSQTLVECTAMDGSDTGSVLSEIFETLDLADDNRLGKQEFAKTFPYVNGGLFRDRTSVPRFSRLSRRILIDTAKMNWAEINPDIFGSMIQAVVKPDMRDELGMHYTSVPNILKVLRPLFIDSVQADIEQAGSNIKKLEATLSRIRRIRVFDPACGSGNFLIIAYKELCRLEMEAFMRLRDANRQYSLPFSEVQLDHFIGIELEDFAVETAKLSLYIAQHQMGVEFKSIFGFGPPQLPLRDSGKIVPGNAAQLDWSSACPPDPSLETYIAGNPPYLGGKKLSASQSADMDAAGLGKAKQLDYIACWFEKASKYIREFGGKFAFVSTSSICQGEQVHLLWPRIIANKQEIIFLHEPFMWSNSAKHNAAVACTIVGVSTALKGNRKVIYGEGYERVARNISPYMIDFDNVYVFPETKPLSLLAPMTMGSNPVDGKNLIVEPWERDRALREDPRVDRFLKRYMGGDDLISDVTRYCIWIEDRDVDLAREIDFIRRRLDACAAYREGAGRDAKKTADRPHRFCYRTYQDRDFVFAPNTSAASRRYIPTAFVPGDVVINHAAFAVYDAEPYVLGLLSSTLHRVWLAAVGGRLGMGYRYSVKLVYNTFPVPLLSEKQKHEIEVCVWKIMATRGLHSSRSLSYLYNPETMPADLLTAHSELDTVIENIYVGKAFSNDTQRLEFLFKRYALLKAKVDQRPAEARPRQRLKVH